VNLKEEMLKEVYNMCYDHKHKEDGSGKLAIMICDKIDSIKTNKEKDSERKERAFSNFLQKQY